MTSVQYRTFLVMALSAALVVASSGCRRKASRDECETLLGRYAELFVSEKSPSLADDEAARAVAKEKLEARGDDNFKNCTSEVSESEFECAKSATTVAAFNKCLE